MDPDMNPLTTYSANLFYYLTLRLNWVGNWNSGRNICGLVNVKCWDFRNVFIFDRKSDAFFIAKNLRFIKHECLRNSFNNATYICISWHKWNNVKKINNTIWIRKKYTHCRKIDGNSTHSIFIYMLYMSFWTFIET